MLTAMVTMFAEDGSVDLDSTAKVAAHLVDHGHDGLVVSGTTGESATTTITEDGETLRTVRETVGDRARVVAGVGTNDTRTTLQLVRQATEAGADGLLLVTPYYNRPSQSGVLHHFEQVAEATDVPIMLYDVPGRTGTQIAWDTYVRIAERDNVVAVKDAVGDFGRGVRLSSELGFAVYSGDDHSNLGWLAHGACGFVSVAGHAAGQQLRAMGDAYRAGDHAQALEIYTRTVPAVDAIMRVPNSGATAAKAALELLGVTDNRRVRSPLVELDEDEVAALRRALTTAGLL